MKKGQANQNRIEKLAAIVRQLEAACREKPGTCLKETLADLRQGLEALRKAA